MGVGLKRIPIRRAPVLRPHDLKQFREIAKGAMPISTEEFPHPAREREPRIFGVFVYDGSMAGDGIEKGAIAVVNPDSSYEVGSTVVAIAPERGRILIRVFRGLYTDLDGRQRINLAAFWRKLPSIESYPYGDDAAQIVGHVRWISRSTR